MFLWTFVVSLLVVAIVQPTSEAETPMRRDYVFPDDVSGDMQEDEIPGGALSLNLLTTQTVVTTGIFPCKEKFPW